MLEVLLLTRHLKSNRYPVDIIRDPCMPGSLNSCYTHPLNASLQEKDNPLNASLQEKDNLIHQGSLFLVSYFSTTVSTD